MILFFKIKKFLIYLFYKQSLIDKQIEHIINLDKSFLKLRKNQCDFFEKLKYKLFKSWFIRKQIKYINNNIKSIISDFDLYNNKKFKILSYKEVELLKDKMNFFQHAKDLIRHKNTIYSCEYFTIQYNIYKIDIIFSALEDDYYFVRIEIKMNLELGQPKYNLKEIYCLEIDQLSNLKRFLNKLIINK